MKIPERIMRAARLEDHYETYQMAVFPYLSEGGGQTFVGGTGDVMAQLMFIGEAPGAEEAELGEPFVGRSGTLLNELLRDIDMHRHEVFITNLVKYRPPNNEDPDDTRTLASIHLMRRELAIISPLVVVPLGSYACRLWWPNPSMGLIAGDPHTKGEKRQVIVPMYHPSWALRGGASKIHLMKEHIQRVKVALDTERQKG